MKINKRIIRTTAALALIAGIAGGLSLAAPAPVRAAPRLRPKQRHFFQKLKASPIAR